MGLEYAVIQQDIIRPGGELRDAAYERAGLLDPVTGEDTRTLDGGKRFDSSSRENTRK
jgi:hypothetical protein